MKDEYPLIKNMDGYGFNLSEDELIYVLSEIYGEPVTKRGGRIYNKKLLYSEDSDGFWSKIEYDENGNQIYYESSDGFWGKMEYDENGYQTYGEDSNGIWEKFEYDDNGKQIYYENSDGEIEDYR